MEKPICGKVFVGKNICVQGNTHLLHFQKFRSVKILDLYATSSAFRHCILFKHIRICSRFVSSWHPHVISIA